MESLCERGADRGEAAPLVHLLVLLPLSFFRWLIFLVPYLLHFATVSLSPTSRIRALTPVSETGTRSNISNCSLKFPV
jgi:hypothetical protein